MHSYRVLLVALVSLFMLNTVLAQEESISSFWKRENHFFDVSGSVGDKQEAVALSWNYFHGVGKGAKRFKIGYGIRGTGFWSVNQKYVTAPAKLTSGTQGPHVLFTENILDNFDTVQFTSTQANCLNLTINLQYSITQKLELGFNIDAIGVTLGSSQFGYYYSTKNAFGEYSTQQTAKPTFFNLLLVSDNDLGSLNSELYARYWITNKLAVRAGLTFLFSEYTLDSKVRLDNDRFRYKSLMPMIGVSFSPFRK